MRTSYVNQLALDPVEGVYIAILHIGVQPMSSGRALEEAKKGSAEIVILAIVEDESHHGYEIAKLIARADRR